jgi:carboxypeptidase family protein
MLAHTREGLARVITHICILATVCSLLPVSYARASYARAQSTAGSISGRVLDLSARPLAGARITVLNIDNGNARATLTDQGGYYEIAFLTPAIYSVSVSLPGYKDDAYPEVRIQLNKMNVVLPPFKLTSTTAGGPTPAPAGPISTPPPSTSGTVGREIEVLINTSDATRGGNFNETQIESLPVGGTTDMRSFDELSFLVAGVAPPPFTPGVRGPGVGFGIGTAGQFSVNGSRARSNNFSIDGSDNNDPDVGVRRQGFVALVPQSIESIREFQIATLLWDAQLGRNLGSQVNAVSKEGRNKFHGQVYGFFTDSKLNARNFFDYTGGASDGEDAFTRSQLGLVVGGPVASDRTQFFSSFERLVINHSTEQHFASPAASERRFLGLPRFGVLKFSSDALVNEFFATDLGATPLGDNVLSFYPLPNNGSGPYGANTYTEVLPADGDASIFSLKLTHQLNQRNTLDARYNFTDDSRVLPAVNRAIRSTTQADTRTHNLSLIFDTQLGERLFNQARFSYGRTRLEFQELADSPFNFEKSTLETVNTNTGDVIIPSATGLIGELLIEPFSPVGVNAYSFPQRRVSNTFQYADSLSWSVGAHSLKFGADVRRVQLNNLLDRNYRPQVIYSGGLLSLGTLSLNPNPSDPFVDPFRFTSRDSQFLSGIELAALGLPSSIFQTITAGTPDSTIGLRFTEYSFFFNDNWRVRPNFTIDYGVRYEYNSVPREVNDRIENALSLSDLPSPGGSRFDSSDRTAFFNAAVEAYRRVLGGRTEIYEPDRNNFGPHVGFAWDPWSNGKTAIRGGYGIYYDAILGAVVSQSRNVFPNEIPVNVEPGFLQFDAFVLNNPSALELEDDAGDIRLIAPGSGNQFGGSTADFVALIGELFRQNSLGGGLAFTLPDKNLRTPYSQQWHLTIERQILGDYLLRTAYVGTKGTKLTRLTTPNLGPNVTPSILFADRFNIPFSFEAPPLVLADCILQLNGKCSIQPGRSEPALGAFQIFENSAGSNYHSLQMEMLKRYSNGYQFTVAYTWSHALDDVSDIFPIAGAPIVAQNSFNLRGERASANFDIRHRFAASLIWDLPFYRDTKGTAARWLGGWQVGTIFQAHTGQPFTLTLPNDANLDGNLTDRPSTTDGLVFISGHGRQKVTTAAGKDVTDFFVLGRDGFVGRNTVRADSFVNWDVALSKRFALTERQSLNFRAEFFNALNRANFGTPIRTLGSPGFGSAVETVNPARIVQFGLKYSF